MELPDGWKVTCLYHHSEDDCVYLGADTPEGSGVWEFEAGEAMPYRWRSKEFFTSALTGMGAVRISGRQAPGNPVWLAVFGPGERPRDTVRMTGEKAVRLKTTRSERVWSFALSGLAEVYEVRLGASVQGVEYGG